MKENHVDIILSDVRMELMDGIDTYKEIQKIKKVKTIFMTGNCENDQLKEIQSFGCKILHKPFTRQELYKMIDTEAI